MDRDRGSRDRHGGDERSHLLGQEFLCYGGGRALIASCIPMSEESEDVWNGEWEPVCRTKNECEYAWMMQKKEIADRRAQGRGLSGSAPP